MQKKLLTAAVAGALSAPGLALAQVEIYGFVNMSVGHFKFDDVPTGVSKWDVANHASNYGVRGRENIGGGQTFWFQIETHAPLERSNNVATTPASRNSAVGLQGSWGNLFLGQWTTPWADLDALWSVGTVGGWGPSTSVIGRRETSGAAPNINCANTGHGVTGACDAVESTGGVGHPFWRRVSQAVFYQSPVMGGVQLKLAYQTNEGKATAGATANADPSLWSAAVQWAGMGGRVRAGFALDRHRDFSSVGQTDDGWKVVGGWNFGVADVGIVYERMTYALSTAAGGVQGAVFSGNECEAEQYGLAVAVPVGMGAIRGSWAKAKDLEGTGCSGVTGNPGLAGAGGGKMWNVGYEHRFSKRSSVGFGYATIENDPGGTFNWSGTPPNQGGAANGPVAGGDMSTFFVNFFHRF